MKFGGKICYFSSTVIFLLFAFYMYLFIDQNETSARFASYVDLLFYLI